MLPKLRPLVVGAATFLPGAPALLGAAKSSMGLGGADSARYCYSAWLRHAVLLASHALWRPPAAVAELGPGDSLGIGFSALLSGASEYSAFDVLRFADPQRNLVVFDELVELFRQRAAIPDDGEFPELTPRLRDYRFPASLWPAGALDAALASPRVASLRAAIVVRGSEGPIRYVPDWQRSGSLPSRPVDIVVSQAVLEHVDDLAGAYSALSGWLRPGGFMSHAVDFRCHNMFPEWNGHWTAAEPVWRVVRGRRPYLINREPLSRHLGLLAGQGFCDVHVERYVLPSRVTANDLAPRFAGMTAEDLVTGMATIQARRPFA